MIRVANILVDGRFAGPHHRVLQVAPRLRPRGIETLVVIPASATPTLRERVAGAEVESVAVRLHHLSRARGDLVKWALLFVPESLSLARMLRRRGVHIVHCNGIWHLQSILAGRWAGRRVVLHLNDTRDARSLRCLARRVGPLCHAVIFASHRSRDFYRQIAPALDRKPSSIVQAPVDCVRFDPDQTDPHPALAQAPGPRLVSIGNINVDKGFDNFVEMGRILRESGRAVTLHIVGPRIASQERVWREVQARASELPEGAVCFHGAVADIPAVLKAADIYVCASISEASPMSVWEAMAMRRPIVATDVGDVARFITDGANGFVVPPGDIRAMADRVARLLDSPRMREEFGARARQTALEQLDLPVCVASHAAFYERIHGMAS